MKRPTRIMEIRPGYDCKFGPCEHEQKGEHGIHSEEWFYVVTDWKTAVNLTICSGRFPSTVPQAHLSSILHLFPMAADLGAHSTVPQFDGHRPMDSCRYIEGECFYDGSGLRAGHFWASHGDVEQANQGEDFWIALEAEWRREAGHR